MHTPGHKVMEGTKLKGGQLGNHPQSEMISSNNMKLEIKDIRKTSSKTVQNNQPFGTGVCVCQNLQVNIVLWFKPHLFVLSCVCKKEMVFESQWNVNRDRFWPTHPICMLLPLYWTTFSLFPRLSCPPPTLNWQKKPIVTWNLLFPLLVPILPLLPQLRFPSKKRLTHLLHTRLSLDGIRMKRHNTILTM